MKKEEVSYLEMIKQEEGIGKDRTKDEIRDFINTQKGFRLLKHETKKKDTIIKNLEKRTKKLEEKIEQIKSKNISKNKNKGIKLLNNLKIISNKKKLGIDVFRETISKSEEKKIKIFVNRIKHNINHEEYTRTDIKIQLMIPQRYLDKCINKLKEDDFINSRLVSGKMRYYKK